MKDSGNEHTDEVCVCLLCQISENYGFYKEKHSVSSSSRLLFAYTWEVDSYADASFKHMKLQRCGIAIKKEFGR
jgi:hypothetical protein